MDMSSIFTALSGGGVKVVISLNAVDPVTNPGVVPMSHVPNWKLRKNPFWRLKQSQHVQQHQPQPTPPVNNPQLQPSTAGLYHGEVIPAPAPPAANVHTIFAYEASQPVEGAVSLILPPGKKAEHLGIKIQFIGRIEMGPQLIHEGKPHYDFISLSKELAPPGTLFQQETRIPFSFRSIEKEHESYRGRNVSVRYFVRVVVERKLFPPIQKEEDVWVQILGQEPTENEAIKMEVGIEGCLHIEFEYERRAYHLQDTIFGKIHFLLVRIKIKHMELAVIRRETSGEGVAAATALGGGATTSSEMASAATGNAANNIFTETQTLVKYEIMDGAPVKGEVIPVKLSLWGIPADLTPTYTAVNNRFSVRYFLNLVLIDEEDRRYFKQQEIILWRKQLG